MSTQVTPGARGAGYLPLQPWEVAEDEVDLAKLSSFFQRHRRLLLACLLAGMLVGAGIALIWPRSYTARASFLPQGSTQMSSLASLASQFGVSVPVSDASRSPGFYAALLVSPNLLADVVGRSFRLSADNGGSLVPLMDYLRANGRTPDLRRQVAIEKLGRKMAVSVDQKAGLVRLEVRLHDPLVSRDVARALIAEVDSFNLKSRQSQASSERRFTEQRMAEARGEARQADDELQAFLQRNRDFRTSPQLVFTYDRLSANSTLRQQIYTSVAEAYEKARIEEARDTPVITVVESPMLPARADRAPYARMMLAGAMLAFLVAGLLGKRADHREALGA
ncbi:MAG TPA: Wzz/FepE/Etk N-terminal domain-containing protein [Acidobacteriaceae bacterium]|nr:Wzz/FepE/Etk N-terminal domain-containing protein [Acidobacteriaceae bacterium]